ncbi:MAG: hypothetical protein AAGH90_05015, partial [Pseudomonadota bacterium]
DHLGHLWNLIMPKQSLFLSLTCAVFGLTACVTAVPFEDRPRSLNLSWTLEPETTDLITQTVDQGEIFFSWTATANATHIVGSGSSEKETIAITNRFGNMYCALSNPETSYCYEDRDADGRTERRWDVNYSKSAPFQLQTASTPVMLETPLPIKTLEESDSALISQKLGLLYNGAVEGTLDDDFNFTVMIGELLMGWMLEKDTPRDPSGDGWVRATMIPVILVGENKPETTVKNLAFTYKILGATLEGDLSISYQVDKIEDVNLRERFEFDVKGVEEEPGLDTVSFNRPEPPIG